MRHNQGSYRKQPNYNPGRNSTIVEFYDQSEFDLVQNELGEYVQKPKLIAKDWAEIIDTSGREFIENNVDSHTIQKRLRMRKRDDIRVENLVVLNSKVYKLDYISSLDRFMELVITWQK